MADRAGAAVQAAPVLAAAIAHNQAIHDGTGDIGQSSAIIPFGPVARYNASADGSSARAEPASILNGHVASNNTIKNMSIASGQTAPPGIISVGLVVGDDAVANGAVTVGQAGAFAVFPGREIPLNDALLDKAVAVRQTATIG